MLRFNRTTLSLIWPLSLLAFSLIFSALTLPSYASPPSPIAHGSVRALYTCGYGARQGGWEGQSKIYSADDKELPTPLQDVFEGRGAETAVRVCTDYDGNVHYYFRVPQRFGAQLGVCEINEVELFRGNEMALSFGPGDDFLRLPGWTRTVPPNWNAIGYQVHNDINPVTFDQLHDTPCPRGDDANYIHVINVSPGMFKAAILMEQSAQSSDTEFGKVYTGGPNPSSFPAWHGALAGITDMSCDARRCTAHMANRLEMDLDATVNGMVITRIYMPPQL